MSKAQPTINVLETALSLVRKGWCKGAFAVNKHGVPVNPSSRSAIAWCASGALSRAGDGITGSGYEAVRRAARIDVPVSNWNDRPQTKKRDVIMAFNRAIKQARAAIAKAQESR